MSQANSSIEGGNALAALLGPALAGALIPFIGAPNVLYVDAATYLVAFVLVLGFVPRRKAVAAAAQHGVLAGLAVPRVATSSSARSRATVTVFGFLAAGMSAGLPVLRVRRVRRELLDRGALLCRSRRGRGRRQRARGLRREEGAAAATRRVRDPGLLDPAVGASLPPAVAGRVRRALPRDPLHAARQRPDPRRAHLSHAGRSATEGDDGRDLGEHARCAAGLHRRGAGARALGRRPAVRRRRARDHMDGDPLRRDHVAALGRRAQSRRELATT